MGHGTNAKFPSEVWLGTLNTDHFDEVQTVYTDEHAAQYVGGMAFQWAGASIIGIITNGARAYVYWNPILDGPSNGSSHWGWKQNSMISTWNSSVVLNPE